MTREYHFRVKANPEEIREILDRLDGEIPTMATV